MTPLKLAQPEDWEKLTSLHPRVAVLFTTLFCGGCRMVKPVLLKNRNKLPRLYEIDAAEYPEITKKYGVTKVPTVILFHKGEFLAKLEDLGQIKVDTINAAYPKSED